MAKGMTQFQKLFAELDSAMDDAERIKAIASGAEHPQSSELIRLRGVMQGLAFAVVTIMDPIFPDARSVAIEVKRRYDARVAGGEPHQTPGVDYTWRPSGEKGEPISTFQPDGPRPTNAPAPRRPAASRRAGAGVSSVETRAAAVDESVKDSVTMGFRSGAFTVEELAGAFNLKIDVVQYLVDQPVPVESV